MEAFPHLKIYLKTLPFQKEKVRYSNICSYCSLGINFIIQKDKINVYLHKEGVISTATELFDMIEIDNPLIHITTEAVQITSKYFGEYEPGNKVDFHAFQSYLNAVYGDKYNFMGQAFPRMQ